MNANVTLKPLDFVFLIATFLFTTFFTFCSPGLEPEAWAKCEKELADLKAAEQGLNKAQQAYDAAKAAHDKAAKDLDQAVANLNAVAQGLGVRGQVTRQSITHGRSPTDTAFYFDPAYKAAEKAWRAAKAALAGAEGALDRAGQERMRAQDEYDAAKKAYEECMRKPGDLELLRAPEPLKLDDKLTEETRKLIGYHHLEDTQRKVTVDAHISLTRDNFLQVEFISHPPGKVRLLSTELVSPEGKVYGPKDTYEVSEEAARNLGRLRPMAVPKGQKKSGLSAGRVGSALLGTGLAAALSGMGGGSHAQTAYDSVGYATKTASTSHTALSTLGAAAGATALARSGGPAPSPSQEIEWIQPATAGTGLFSSIAQFDHPLPSSSHKPWHLKAVMDHLNGKTSTYDFKIPSRDWWAAYQKWLEEQG